MKYISASVLLLLLAGCTTVKSEAPQPPTETTQAIAECLPVAQSLVDSISQGLQPGITFSRIAATVATDRGQVWFIAGELSGDGIDQGQAIGLWATASNPDGSSLGLTMSVDGFAHQFSDWPDGRTSSFAMSSQEGGAQEALACLQ